MNSIRTERHIKSAGRDERFGQNLTFDVMITSKDRVDDLRVTLEQILRLRPKPHEVLITADGCMDNTVSMIRDVFPDAILIENHPALGSVRSRDEMLRRSASDLVLSLDDDSYPEQLDTVSKLVRLFEQRPNLAVAHFPQRTDEYPVSLKRNSFGPPKLTASYANSGACYRRKIFKELGGFEGSFFHSYEEPDYALRCISNGLDVMFWPEIVIRHHYSNAGRSEIATHHRHARNELWSCLLRCPLALLPIIIIYRSFSQLRYAFTRGSAWVKREPEWWAEALKGAASILHRRRPVTTKGYLRWLRLIRFPERVFSE